MAASVSTTPIFSAGPPHVLFETRMQLPTEPYPFRYDTVDGQRFLMNVTAPGGGPTIGVLVNWAAGLKKR